MRTTDTHVYFWGGIYSQWYKTPFVENNKTFPTAEHYMMYHKAITFEPLKADLVLETDNPRKVKEIGRSLKNFDKDVWDSISAGIVTQGNYLKFTQNNYILQQLLADNPKQIVEASPTDTIWGVGLAEDDPLILNKATWRGENRLGMCIMAARDKIIKENLDTCKTN